MAQRLGEGEIETSLGTKKNRRDPKKKSKNEKTV